MLIALSLILFTGDFDVCCCGVVFCFLKCPG